MSVGGSRRPCFLINKEMFTLFKTVPGITRNTTIGKPCCDNINNINDMCYAQNK